MYETRSREGGTPRAMRLLSTASSCDSFNTAAVAPVKAGHATWDVILSPWLESECSGEVDDEWEGLIGVDAEGFVGRRSLPALRCVQAGDDQDRMTNAINTMI